MNEQTLVVLPEEVQKIADLVSIEKRDEVNQTLNNIFAGTADWKAQVDAIEVKGIDDVMSIKLADAARLNAKNARLKAEKLFDDKRDAVQSQMQSYQTEDKLWLKAKQTMQILFKDIEDSAKYKAEYAKRYEAEQKELKTLQRINRIQPLAPDMNRSEFENMSDDTFETFINGIQKAIEEKKEAERIAEEARQEAIKQEAERIEAQRIENERLKKEREELAKKELIRSQRNEEMRNYVEFISDYNAMLDMNEEDYQKKYKQVQEANEKQIKFEIEKQRAAKAAEEKREAELKAERETAAKAFAEQQRLAKIESDKQAAILAEQAKENARIASELKAKQDAELEAENKRKADELKAQEEAKKLAKAPIKQQLQVWVNEISIGQTPNHETAKLIQQKFEAFKVWALQQVESI